MVAISRSRSVMLMFVRLYSTMNASAAAQTTTTTTMYRRLSIIVATRARKSLLRLTEATFFAPASAAEAA